MGRKLIPFNDQVYPEPNTGCWLWGGYCNEAGYGQIPGSKHDGFNLAHRYSYFLKHGNFDRNLCLLHKCDNTFCVNPDHLILGTTSDNNKDRHLKGRTASGTKIPRAKLDDATVISIRKQYSDGVRQCELMRKYNIGDAAICKIVRGKNWKHLL